MSPAALVRTSFGARGVRRRQCRCVRCCAARWAARTGTIGSCSCSEYPWPCSPIIGSDGLAQMTGARDPAGPPITGFSVTSRRPLFGLGCLAPGSAKVTLGTARSFWPRRAPALLCHLQAASLRAPGVEEGETSYALEGFIPAADRRLTGSAGVRRAAAGAELDAAQRSRTGRRPRRVRARPAGPRNAEPGPERARSVDRNEPRHDARPLGWAIVDGVLHQIADALDAISAEMPLRTVSAHGGMSRSDWSCSGSRILADCEGLPCDARRGDRDRRGDVRGVWRPDSGTVSRTSAGRDGPDRRNRRGRLPSGWRGVSAGRTRSRWSSAGTADRTRSALTPDLRRCARPAAVDADLEGVGAVALGDTSATVPSAALSTWNSVSRSEPIERPRRFASFRSGHRWCILATP